MGTLTTITATDAAYGAIGDGVVHLFDPSKSAVSADDRAKWHGQYTAGVDTLDYIGLQEAIYAAFGAPGKEHGVQMALRNVPLYIPPGRYLINKPLRITHLMGGRVIGGGRMSTVIIQMAAGTPVLTTNGISFSRIEGIAFHSGAPVTFHGRWKAGTAYPAGATVCAIDGGIWRATAAGTAGTTEPSWGSSPARESGGIVWERVPPFALVTVDWDATSAGGWTGACQSNTFADCHFSGENRGVDFGVAIAPTGGNSMGSENLFTNCFWQWFTTAGFVTMGFNALQNTIVGGNFEGCPRYAVWFYKGAGAVYSTGFQNGFLSQIAMNGSDIMFSNSTDDASVVTGCRTESGRFVVVENYHKVSVRGCAIVPPMAVWTAGGHYPAGSTVVGRAHTDGIAYYTTAGGIVGATEPAWGSAPSISDGTVTWLPLNHNAVSGANLALDDCVVLYGRVGLDSNVVANGHVHGCSFSRPDWLNEVGAGSWSIMNNIVNLAGGPNNSHGPARYSIDDGYQPKAPKHRAVLGLGRDSAILFPTPQVAGVGPLPSVGLTRGDARRDILGVYGAIGRPTPVADDLVTTPADAAGSDLTLVGGLSVGAGVPGRIVLQTADGGPAGAVVNEPVTRLSVSAGGVVVGAGGARVRKLVATSVGWAPKRVAAGGVVALEASLYGVAVGDVVGAAFSRAVPAGCLVQASVIAPGRVRVEVFNLSGAPVAIDAGRVRLESWLLEPIGAVAGAAEDVAQLVSDLGDVAAVYDARVGVTTTAWNDARGAGPALVASGASHHNPIAGTITGGAWRTAANAAFDLSHPMGIVFVGAIGRVWAGEPAVVVGVGNDSRSVALESDRTGGIAAVIDGRTRVAASVGASGATRVVAVTVPTGSTFGVQVGGGAAVSQHIATAFPAGAYQLTVGSGPFVVRAVVVLRGVLDAERWERVGQWAAAVHGAESSA